MTDKWKFTEAEDQHIRDNWHRATRLIADGMKNRGARSVLERGRRLGLPARPDEVLSLVWTPELDAQLERLITVERLSYGSAAGRLGMKKTQVASRCRTRGIQAAVLPGFRNAGSAGTIASAMQPKPVEMVIAPEEDDADAEPVQAFHNGYAITQCNFPVRKVGRRHLFCGEPIKRGSVYCADCHARAHKVPMPSPDVVQTDARG